MEFDATFIVAAISFILFVLIMNKIYYAPILKIMSERKEYVASNYSEAEKFKLKISSNQAEKNSKLEEIRSEGRQIINDKSREFKADKEKKVHEARIESVNKIAKTKDELLNNAYASQEVLINNTVGISKEISKMLLGEDVSTDLINGEELKNIERLRE